MRHTVGRGAYSHSSLRRRPWEGQERVLATHHLGQARPL